MSKRKQRILSAILLIIFALYILAISPRQMQNDTFWSIKVGEKIINEGIFGIDNFSIHEGLYYIAHHFLTDILIYLVYSITGFAGLYAMEVILAGLIAYLLYLLNKEISGSKTTSIIMTFAQMGIMSMFIAVRAQMISYILFILEILLLEKHKKNNNKKYIIGLSIIPILLANFHMGTVPFYFIILGVYFISYIKLKLPFLENVQATDISRIKQILLVAIIGLVTIFINPYTIDGVIYPFKTFGNEFINTTIQEFQNLRISFDGGFSLFYIAFTVLVLIITNKKIQTGDFLLIFGTMFMSFVAIRYISLFVICSSVVLRYLNSAINTLKLKEIDIKSIKWTSLFLITLITLVVFARYMARKDIEYISNEEYPVQAVEFLKQEMKEQDRIFNLYDWGSYLMLNNIKVYIDSRCDLYTKEYNGTDIATDHNKLMLCDTNYKEIIEKYNINMFIIPKDESLATLLEENDKFNLIYKDDICVIYKQI